MPGWADVAERTDYIGIRGKQIEVVALSLGDIADLLAKFPGEANNLLTMGSMADDACVALIAKATGASEDMIAQKKIAGLSVGEKAACLLKIIKVTMPDGPRPFVELASELRMINPERAAAILAALDSGTSLELLQAS